MARVTRVAAALVCLSLLTPGLSSGVIVRPQEEGARTAQPRNRVPDQEPRTAQPRQRAPDQDEGRKAEPRDRDRRGPEPTRPRPTVVVRGRVFVGGYFYDPFFGPYPWWPRTAYPHWYYPVYDHRAEVRVQVAPKEAAVYVDGFYAGIVDDFDGIFQPLFLPPGGHQIALYLEGFRTVFHNVYLRPGSSLKLHDRLERLPPGVRSEPPMVAPPLPPPPHGSYQPPRTPAPPTAPAPGPVRTAEGYGTLEIRVLPVTAEVTVDGERWLSSDEGRYVLQLAPGAHRVEAALAGHQTFSTEVTVTEAGTTPLNVSLMPLR
jgi:hypothetical protein